ncbi:MAG: Gfo/Idh/MocA family oxidoreductase [Erysipelotrichaceae bacterium]|nr:Gfo/Idh/MocA family oxidoreductase [Erysipelotrichaceae bacterium]
MNKHHWGIIGTGWIAHDMGRVMEENLGGVHAVAGTSLAKSLSYQQDVKTDKVYANYHELLADQDIDCVYIATPHASHYQIMKDALLAGKHVLCEKAITTSSAQLEECVRIAEERDLVICDGTTIPHMPLYRRLKEEITRGVIGQVRMVQVNFGSVKEYTRTSRFFDPYKAGGALLDIGIYALTFARYFLNSYPDTILSTMQLLDNGVDESDGILLKNRDGELGVVSLTLRAKQPKRGIITGTEGFIEINEYPRADEAAITIVPLSNKVTLKGTTTVIKAGKREDALLYELQDMDRYIEDKAAARENLKIIREVMRIISEVRRQCGLKYPFEETIEP